jgi:hypothetical protein
MNAIGSVIVWIHREVQHFAWWFLGRCFNRGSRMHDLVQANGIAVFVGPNGSGKSLLAVDAFLTTLAGLTWECDDFEHLHNRPVRVHVLGCEVCTPHPRRPIWCQEAKALLEVHGRGVRLAYSTLPLLDDATGDEHPLFRPLIDYRQLVEIEHADVLFDEVAGISDASDSASTPAALTRWLQQLRKRDVRLRVTTPAYDRCSKPIRQVATLVIDCRSFFPEASSTGRLWRPRRAMWLQAFDGFDFATFEKNSGERQSTMARQFYWRATGRAQNSYSTLAQVTALADVTDAGMCMACGGGRSRPRCSCGPEVDAIPYGELQVVEQVSAAGARVRRAVHASSK